jgi:hypothetical protein
MSFLQTNTHRETPREREREKQLYGCNTLFGDRKEKTARLSAAAAAATTGFAAATTSCKLQQLPMPPCKLKHRGNNHYQQPANQPASSKRNQKIISDVSENLQSKIAIKHSELHSVLDGLLSLPDLLLLLLLLLSSFLFFSFIDGSIWLTIIRLMIPMISRNTFLFSCLSFFHTLRVVEEV